jgi:hypothetical protein
MRAKAFQQSELMALESLATRLKMRPLLNSVRAAGESRSTLDWT